MHSAPKDSPTVSLGLLKQKETLATITITPTSQKCLWLKACSSPSCGNSIRIQQQKPEQSLFPPRLQQHPVKWAHSCHDVGVCSLKLYVIAAPTSSLIFSHKILQLEKIHIKLVLVLAGSVSELVPNLLPEAVWRWPTCRYKLSVSERPPPHRDPRRCGALQQCTDINGWRTGCRKQPRLTVEQESVEGILRVWWAQRWLDLLEDDALAAVGPAAAPQQAPATRLPWNGPTGGKISGTDFRQSNAARNIP